MSIPDHIEDYMKDHQFQCMTTLLEVTGIKHTVMNGEHQSEIIVHDEQEAYGVSLYYNHEPTGDRFVCQE